jgi:hypothetical protein
MKEWQKWLVLDRETRAIFESLENENWGRPTAFADLGSLAAQVSGVEMYRLCAGIRKLDLIHKAANQYNFLGFAPGDSREFFKQVFTLIDTFGLGFDDSPTTGKGFLLWIHSPIRFKRWTDSAAPTSDLPFALSNEAFNRLTRDGVGFQSLAKLITGAKVLQLFQAVRDLEYTRTLKGRYWKWMMGDLYPADQDAELKSLCGLKLDRWRKQTDDTVVFDVGDREKLRAWIESDT